MSKMLYWDELKNTEELRGELREMLIRFMIDCNEYDTDVYLYIDEETSEGELYEFTNVGGNSWLDDDHITIYTDKQHYESFYDLINDVDELAEALNMSGVAFRCIVMRWLDKIGEWYEDSDIEDIELEDAIRYVDQNDALVTAFAAGERSISEITGVMIWRM